MKTASTEAQSFTWGIEIECTVPVALTCGNGPIRIGSYHNGNQIRGLPEGWTAERDSSIRTNRAGYIGVEIVSPIMRGRDGLDELKRVGEQLNAWGARVNPTCGLHVHVGIPPQLGDDFGRIAEWVEAMVAIVSRHEKVLYATTGSRSRLHSSYCGLMRNKMAASWTEMKGKKGDRWEWQNAIPREARYQTLNLGNLFSKRTIEFRCFQGTTSEVKHRVYVQLCLGLAELALTKPRQTWPKTVREGNKEGVKRVCYLLRWKWASDGVCLGWIAPLDELDEHVDELCRLADKFTGSQ